MKDMEKKAITSSDLHLLKKWLPAAFGVGGSAALIANLVSRFKENEAMAEKYEDTTPDDIFYVNLDPRDEEGKKAASATLKSIKDFFTSSDQKPYTALGSGMAMAGVPIAGLLGYVLLDKLLTSGRNKELEKEIEGLQNSYYSKKSSTTPGFGVGDALKGFLPATGILLSLASAIVANRYLTDKFKDPGLAKLKELDSDNLLDTLTGAPKAFKIRTRPTPAKEELSDNNKDVIELEDLEDEEEGITKTETGEAKLLKASSSNELEHLVNTVVGALDKDSGTYTILKAASMDIESLISREYRDDMELIKTAAHIVESSNKPISNFSRAVGLSVMCRNSNTASKVASIASCEMLEASPMLMEVVLPMGDLMRTKLASVAGAFADVSRDQVLKDGIPESTDAEKLLELLLQQLKGETTDEDSEVKKSPEKGSFDDVAGQNSTDSKNSLESKKEKSYDDNPNEDVIDRTLS